MEVDTSMVTITEGDMAATMAMVIMAPTLKVAGKILSFTSAIYPYYYLVESIPNLPSCFNFTEKTFPPKTAISLYLITVTLAVTTASRVLTAVIMMLLIVVRHLLPLHHLLLMTIHHILHIAIHHVLHANKPILPRKKKNWMFQELN